jgi:hypothetical protein
MFLPVSRALLMAMGLLATLAVAPAQASGPKSGGPTAAQIRKAVASAEHSPNLWATVNICNTRHHRYVLGIRTQVPALGFSSSISVRVRVTYWNGKKFKLDPNPGASKLLPIGVATNGTRQAGWNFQFGKNAGLLGGRAIFTWVRAGKTIGTITEKTTGGHGTQVKGAAPPGHSEASCKIG